MAKGLGNIMKMAQQAQKQMMKVQEELADKRIEASSGGGMVTVVVNGKHELLSINIQPEAIDPEDPEMLQDLIVAAVNEAMRQAQELITAEMQKVTGGMGIDLPGLF
ncbi:MAG: YbaB/EbfC family nucleoid-associated protein [Candidatus Lernaella stagnicola]|nr:YbaB/EbfC family nucleoid-associated protein [Candidatus Lernaella stagnicola]